MITPIAAFTPVLKLPDLTGVANGAVLFPAEFTVGVIVDGVEVEEKVEEEVEVEKDAEFKPP
jgi:hypothetical protein